MRKTITENQSEAPLIDLIETKSFTAVQTISLRGYLHEFLIVNISARRHRSGFVVGVFFDPFSIQYLTRKEKATTEILFVSKIEQATKTAARWKRNY